MVRLELEREALEFIIAKLDLVGGTRPICNRLQAILIKTEEQGAKLKQPEDKKPRFSVVATEECSLREDDLPLIKPGRYTARYTRHSLRKGMFKDAICKLQIHCEVSDNGLPKLVELEAWFKVNETKNGFSVSKCVFR